MISRKRTGRRMREQKDPMMSVVNGLLLYHMTNMQRHIIGAFTGNFQNSPFRWFTGGVQPQMNVQKLDPPQPARPPQQAPQASSSSQPTQGPAAGSSPPWAGARPSWRPLFGMFNTELKEEQREQVNTLLAELQAKYNSNTTTFGEDEVIATARTYTLTQDIYHSKRTSRRRRRSVGGYRRRSEPRWRCLGR